MKHKKYLFSLILPLFLLNFSSAIAAGEECETKYGGNCSDSCGANKLSLGVNVYGCDAASKCCVYPCNGTDVRGKFGNQTICQDKTSSECENEMQQTLDCEQKFGSNGICCIKPKEVAKSCGPTQEDGGKGKVSGVCKPKTESCSGADRTQYNSDCGSEEKCCEVIDVTVTPPDDPYAPKTPDYNQGIVPCGNSSQSLCTLCHLIIGIKRLIDWGKNLLVTITFVGIFISGVMYIISAGEEAMTTQAKKFLSASLIGFTVTMAAWLIVNVVITWVASAKPDLGIGKTGWSTFTCDTTSTALTGGGGTPGGPTPASQKCCVISSQEGVGNYGKAENCPAATGGTTKAECEIYWKDYYGTDPAKAAELKEKLATCKDEEAKCDTATGGTLTENCSTNPACGGEKTTGTPDGYTYDPGIEQQMSDASNELKQMLTCMQPKLPTEAKRISSISDSAGMARCATSWNRPPCAHAQNSCHYGGASCKGKSYAADFANEQYQSQISSAASQCNGRVNAEGNHIHVSVQTSCCSL
ncbi:MAG: hypothetical protein A2259_05260 [Candidatus Moranbacteria bacterium RIFOXYA2_FULL_43_15]|nr:MAG: hypothetical protein A2259_05260 [Candidatus Moranbacteria bacterium RIFOXYA2_FULL_43_15]